ncbi:MAG: hypothetical protein Q9174_001788 [Haloplaca sp. 1 TL-2023]
MGLASKPPILSELRSSTSAASQVTALRALKNAIIGYEQNKRLWIGQGVLVPLVRIINTVNGIGKRREQTGTRSTQHGKAALARSDEVEARIQAIIIIGSLAHGGPAFIPPIVASSVIPSLLALLAATDSCDKVVLAALRTLNSVADASALEHLGTNGQGKGLVHSLYTEDGLTGIVQLLSQNSSSSVVQEQIALSAALIGKTCHDDGQRSLLVRRGVLEALACRLSTFIVATDYAFGTARQQRDSHDGSGILPATTRSRLAPILAAIGRIIDTSKSRAQTFLSTPSLTVVLLRLEANIAGNSEKKAAPWQHSATFGSARPSVLSKLDDLLPQIPNLPNKTPLPESSYHPPLGIIGTSTRQPLSPRTPNYAQDTTYSQASKTAPEVENPLIAWLIYIARAESGVARSMAAWIISLFYRSGLIEKQREPSLAMLLVPLLVRSLDKNARDTTDDDSANKAHLSRSTQWDYQEQAPEILAVLTLDSPELQRAAVDAGVIKKLAQLLKETYNPLPTDTNMSQWNAEPQGEIGLNGCDETSSVVDSNVSPVDYQLARVREATLKAFGAIASIRDDYRKAIIDNGVIPFLIESLKSERGIQTNGDQIDNATHSARNSKGVILAACGAARSLSRSVSTLRTSLMDAGLAAPLFALLKHDDVKVQIAATAVITNLVLEFSPMREAILEAGVLGTLCEHSRSLDPTLRLGSMWALKHLILSAPKSLKRECLEQLGRGWVSRIICDEDADAVSFSVARLRREASVGTPLAMGTSNAAGEQVDLLNTIQGSRKNGQTATEDDEDDSKMADSIGALSGSSTDSQQRGHAQSPWRAPDRRGENGATTQIRFDDTALQKQGLDFVRNLICGTDSHEMIDCLFEEAGPEKVFELLIGKLRPRLINAFNRERRSGENGVRQLAPQPDVIVSVCWIIVHLAAGTNRQRQVLMSNAELLKLLVQLFSHPNREVRNCCSWIVINLTFMEDESDRPLCRERARHLINLGVFDKLQMLESDPELDVRERTKAAMHQLREVNR